MMCFQYSGQVVFLMIIKPQCQNRSSSNSQYPIT